MPEDDSDQPTKRVFLRVPENYYEMSEAEQDEVLGQMADIFIAELGLNDAKPKRKPRSKTISVLNEGMPEAN